MSDRLPIIKSPVTNHDKPKITRPKGQSLSLTPGSVTPVKSDRSLSSEFGISDLNSTFTVKNVIKGRRNQSLVRNERTTSPDPFETHSRMPRRKSHSLSSILKSMDEYLDVSDEDLKPTFQRDHRFENKTWKSKSNRLPHVDRSKHLSLNQSLSRSHFELKKYKENLDRISGSSR